MEGCSLRIIRTVQVTKLLVEARRYVVIVQRQTIVVCGIVMRADISRRLLDIDHSEGLLAIMYIRDPYDSSRESLTVGCSKRFGSSAGFDCKRLG